MAGVHGGQSDQGDIGTYYCNRGAQIELCSPKIALMSSYPAPLVQLHMEMGTLSVQLRLSEVQQGEALIGQGLESFVSLELDIESAGSIIGKTKPEQAH